MEYEDFKIYFPCPECTLEFEVALYQLFPGEVLICPTCGATSSGGELSEINQAFKKLEIEILGMQQILENRDYTLNP